MTTNKWAVIRALFSAPARPEGKDGTEPYFGIGAQLDISKQLHVGAPFSASTPMVVKVGVLEPKAGCKTAAAGAHLA